MRQHVSHPDCRATKFDVHEESIISAYAIGTRSLFRGLA